MWLVQFCMSSHDAFEGQTLLPLKRVCVNCVNVSVFVEGRDPTL